MHIGMYVNTQTHMFNLMHAYVKHYWNLRRVYVMKLCSHARAVLEECSPSRLPRPVSTDQSSSVLDQIECTSVADKSTQATCPPVRDSYPEGGTHEFEDALHFRVILQHWSVVQSSRTLTQRRINVDCSGSVDDEPVPVELSSFHVEGGRVRKLLKE